MTREQYETTRKQYSYLNNGQFLSMFIRGVLNNMDLTMLQASSLDDIKGGSFNPRDKVVYKSILEILELASTDKIDTLITNLKRLPNPQNGTSPVIYLLDGKPCTKGVYFDKDSDLVKGRWDGVVERPVRSRANAPRMSEEDFKQIQEDFIERWTPKEEVIHQPRETPTPIKDEPVGDPNIYSDIGDEDESLTAEQEFEYNEPTTKEWVNRPKKKDDTDE